MSQASTPGNKVVSRTRVVLSCAGHFFKGRDFQLDTETITDFSVSVFIVYISELYSFTSVNILY